MATTTSLLLCSFLALLLSAAKVNAAVDCGVVLTSIFPCMDFLGGEIPSMPSDSCCRSACSILGTSIDLNRLCQCFRANPLSPSSALLQSKAVQLPSLCNLPSFLPLVNCLIPNYGSLPIPSLVPIPGLVVPVPPALPIAFPPVA